jgi:hypothetical protein
VASNIGASIPTLLPQKRAILFQISRVEIRQFYQLLEIVKNDLAAA